MNHFITGIAGFAGSHLAEKLLENGERVFGFDLPSVNTGKIDHLLEHITLFRGNLNVYEDLRESLRECNPDYIYHLAAVSHVKKSFDSKRLTMEINLFGAFNLLESVRELNLKPRILLVGSASQYGRMKENGPPLNENTPLNSMSPYGLSKICQEYLGLQYSRTEKMHVILVRCFNYSGIRQDPDFVCSDFSRQVAEIEREMREPVIKVGNLNVSRDFTDVADMVDAYLSAMAKCPSGEVYNLCSGNVFSIGKILDILLSHSKTPISVKPMDSRFRQADINYLRGDYSKFAALTGWKPQIPFENTLKDILDYWRQNI